MTVWERDHREKERAFSLVIEQETLLNYVVSLVDGYFLEIPAGQLLKAAELGGVCSPLKQVRGQGFH